MINRRDFLAAAAPAVLRRSERPPNVLVILADQWRAQAMGYAGDANARTPAIDSLASRSSSFANAVSGCPVCSPYRGSFLTGQYPLRHGVFINDVPLISNGPTLAEVFLKSGYRTGYIGKWHLFGSPDGKYGRRHSYIPKENRCGFEYWKAAECTHTYNKSQYFAGEDRTPRVWEGYDAIAQTADACEFMGGGGADPFLLMLSLGPPHNPYQTAPAAYQARYRQSPVGLRRNVPAERREGAIGDLRGYYAHIAALDDCVKTLLDRLDRGGLAGDTIVLFTSDHGDMLGSQGLQAKQTPWEESIRVPFLLRYPRKLGSRGRTVHRPIDAPDIMPTLLGLAGLAVPGSVQGSNLSRVAAGEDRASPDDAALLNFAAPFSNLRAFGFAEYRGLRTRRHTYVRSIHGPWLLYDNQADPFQMRNLCGVPGQSRLQSGLDRLLEKKLRAAGDEFLPAARYLEKAGVTHYREVNREAGSVVSPWGDWRATMR